MKAAHAGLEETSRIVFGCGEPSLFHSQRSASANSSLIFPSAMGICSILLPKRAIRFLNGKKFEGAKMRATLV